MVLPVVLPSDDDFVSVFPKIARRVVSSRDRHGKSILSGRKHDPQENIRRRNISFAPRQSIKTSTRRQGLSTYGTNAIQRARARAPVR